MLAARLRSLRPGLQGAHARVVDVVLEDPEFITAATAQQIADRAGVSAATVVRAVRTAGFSGLPELKLVLARAAGSPEGSGTTRPQLSQAHSVADLIDVVTASHAESLTIARGTVDSTALAEAVGLLRRAGRVLVTASGTSLPIAEDAAYRLTMSGVTTQHSADTYTAILLAGQLDAADTVLAVSHSGETRQTLDVVEAARAAGARTVAVTSYSQSTLARTAEVPLVAVGSAAAGHLVESSSRIAHLAVIDVLHTALVLDLPG